MRTKRMIRLWERMTALYGSRWALEYGPALSDAGSLANLAELWADAMDGLSNEQIAAGIRACVDRESPHPPRLPEFLRLCGYRPASRHACHQIAAPSTIQYATSPQQRCQQMADELQAQAERELTPGCLAWSQTPGDGRWRRTGAPSWRRSQALEKRSPVG